MIASGNPVLTPRATPEGVIHVYLLSRCTETSTPEANDVKNSARATLPLNDCVPTVIGFTSFITNSYIDCDNGETPQVFVYYSTDCSGSSFNAGTISPIDSPPVCLAVPIKGLQIEGKSAKYVCVV